MGSGHETTNRSVEHMVARRSAISLGCSVSRLLTQHKPRNRSMVTRPLVKGWGLGTRLGVGLLKRASPSKKFFFTPVIYLLFEHLVAAEWVYLFLPLVCNTCGFREMLFIVTVHHEYPYSH